jgi:hypothetical protein
LPLRNRSWLWKHLVFVESPERMIRRITFLTKIIKVTPRLFLFFNKHDWTLYCLSFIQYLIEIISVIS